MRIRKLKILFLLLWIPLISSGQKDWSVNPAEFEGNMTITGMVALNGEVLNDQNIKVAAFIDNTCRGVASTTYFRSVDKYEIALMIYGNPGETGIITFKVFNTQTNEISNIPEEVTYGTNKIVGDFVNPFIWNTEQSDLKLKVFPNPTSGILSIQLPEKNKPCWIEVRDITGKSLIKTRIFDTNTIDITHLPKGLYYLVIRTGEEVFTRKIIKN